MESTNAESEEGRVRRSLTFDVIENGEDQREESDDEQQTDAGVPHSDRAGGLARRSTESPSGRYFLDETDRRIDSSWTNYFDGRRGIRCSCRFEIFLGVDQLIRTSGAVPFICFRLFSPGDRERERCETRSSDSYVTQSSQSFSFTTRKRESK